MVRTVVLALLALAALPCTAQYPAKPIRIVIPFVAGGSSDIVGRAIGSKFQEFLHQPAVVENRPGANGAIAAEFAASHVPYKGGAACQTDIMGNQVDFSFQNLGAVTNYVKAGRMKALVVTAKARHPQLPNVPSAAEAGYPDLVVTSWQAVAAPARTPREVGAELNDATVRALRSPEIRGRMTTLGFDVVAGTPEEFGAFMKAEIERWTAVVERGGIKPD